MDMDLLRTFVLLARERHMTRAAALLHKTQPAISAQVRRLEEEVGQELFTRLPRGMVLTESGEVFLGYAKEMILTLERGREALDELSTLHRGSLSIGGGATAVGYLLPEILRRFHVDYPGVRIFLKEQGSIQTLRAVVSGELELGVVTLPEGGVLDREWRARLEVECWVEDELCLIVPPGHRLASQKDFGWKDLESSSLVLFEAGTAVRELIDKQLKLSEVGVEVVMELRSIESIKRMVENSIGSGFVSSSALSQADRGLRCREGGLKRRLAIVSRKGQRMSRAARAFYEAMLGPEGAKCLN